MGCERDIVVSYHVTYWSVTEAAWIAAPRPVFSSFRPAYEYAEEHFEWYRISQLCEYTSWMVRFMAGE